MLLFAQKDKTERNTYLQLRYILAGLHYPAMSTECYGITLVASIIYELSNSWVHIL